MNPGKNTADSNSIQGLQKSAWIEIGRKDRSKEVAVAQFFRTRIREQCVCKAQNRFSHCMVDVDSMLGEGNAPI
jgi:hypothetical protein